MITGKTEGNKIMAQKLSKWSYWVAIFILVSVNAIVLILILVLTIRLKDFDSYVSIFWKISQSWRNLTHSGDSVTRIRYEQGGKTNIEKSVLLRRVNEFDFWNLVWYERGISIPAPLCCGKECSWHMVGLDHISNSNSAQVVEGMDVVKKIESFGSQSGKTSKKIIIADCGQC